MTWKKDEEDLLLDDDRIRLHSSGNLIFASVLAEDAGFYSCVAENMVPISFLTSLSLSHTGCNCGLWDR